MGVKLRIPLSFTKNTRDLGGYPLQQTSLTRWKRYYRSDYPKKITESDQIHFDEMNLQAVIDLRTDAEVQSSTHPLSSYNGIRYYHVSLFDSFDAHNAKVGNVHPDDKLKKMYLSILEEERDRVKQVFDVMLKETEGSILFHCTAGKDRTGMIAMLLLGLAGVSDEDIIANYEVSYTLNRNSLELIELSKLIPLHYFESSREFMEETLAHFKCMYPNFEAYFKTLGYHDEQIQQLKQSMIDDEGAE